MVIEKMERERKISMCGGKCYGGSGFVVVLRKRVNCLCFL